LITKATNILASWGFKHQEFNTLNT